MPQVVINKVEKAVKEFKKTGKSVLEISHRSPEFDELLNEINLNFEKLFHLPKDFNVLLLQGGATYQNTFVPMNIPKNLNLPNKPSNINYKDFKELKIESPLYSSLLYLKHQLVIISYLFNATNHESLFNLFHSSSEKLNLILGRHGLTKNNIIVGLFDAHKNLQLKAEIINQTIKTK